MFSEAEIKEAVMWYVIHNQHHLKEELKDLIQQRNDLIKKEDEVFHDDITTQFEKMAKSIICEKIGKDLALSPESVIIILDDLNMDELIA